MTAAAREKDDLKEAERKNEDEHEANDRGDSNGGLTLVTMRTALAATETVDGITWNYIFRITDTEWHIFEY